jgi:hypothetical protein
MTEYIYGTVPQSNRRKDLLFGESKTGKTFLASTYPAPYFIDTDGSLDGVDPALNGHFPVCRISEKDAYGQDRIPIYETVRDLLISLSNNLVRKLGDTEYTIKTLVIDGLTMLSKYFLAECMYDPKVGASERLPLSGKRDPLKQKPTWDEYAALGSRLRNLLVLLEDLPCNVVCTATVYKLSNDNNFCLGRMPGVDGSTRDNLGHFFNGSIYMTREGKNCFANMYGTDKIVSGVRRYQGPDKIRNPRYETIFKEEYFGKG